MEAECADDWERLAKDEIESARIMLAARKWKQAYQHGGIAIECALKCKIMRHLRLNRWPDRRERRDLWTHDLEYLFSIVVDEEEINQSLMQDCPPTHLCAWVIVKDWHIEMRYHNPDAFPEKMARGFLNAADGMGLIEWLLR